jgi:hypothetical protein
MDKFQITMLVGWSFLILTWTIPYLVKDEIKQRLLAMCFNGVALGVFIAYGILRWC